MDVSAWLAEDVGDGDLTTLSVIDEDAKCEAEIRLNEAGVVCGLEAASAGRASVADQLARLGDVVDPTPGAGAGDAPMAYCMKERTRVTIADPRPIVLANGRRAVSGTCSQCGSRVMRLGAV